MTVLHLLPILYLQRHVISCEEEALFFGGRIWAKLPVHWCFDCGPCGRDQLRVLVESVDSSTARAGGLPLIHTDPRRAL